MKRKQVKNYILEEKVGQGMFSTVFLCRHQPTGELYACKKFTRAKMTRTSLKNLHEEIKILSNLP